MQQPPADLLLALSAVTGSRCQHWLGDTEAIPLGNEQGHSDSCPWMASSWQDIVEYRLCTKIWFCSCGLSVWSFLGDKHLLDEVGTDSHTVTLSAQELTLPAKCHILNPDIKVTELGYATSQPQLPLLQVRTLA